MMDGRWGLQNQPINAFLRQSIPPYSRFEMLLESIKGAKERDARVTLARKQTAVNPPMCHHKVGEKVHGDTPKNLSKSTKKV